MTIASNIRVPIFAMKFDPSKASTGSAGLNYKALIIGQKSATGGSLASLKKTPITSKGQARKYFGSAAMITKMIERFIDAAPNVELWAIAVDDPSSGTIGTVAISLQNNKVLAAGEASFYVGDKKFPVYVSASDTPVFILDSLAAAINADSSCVCSAAVSAPVFILGIGSATGTFDPACFVKGSISGTIGDLTAVTNDVLTMTRVSGNKFVNGETISEYTDAGCTTPTGEAAILTDHYSSCTLTVGSKGKGEKQSEIVVGFNLKAGETLPPGITVSGGALYAKLGGAMGVTAMRPVIDAIGDDWFQHIVCPFTDAVALQIMAIELASRFDEYRMIDAVMFSAINDSYQDIGMLGAAQNSPHMTILQSSMTPTWSCELAAAYAGNVAKSVSEDSNANLQKLPLPGVMAPTMDDRFTFAENNALLNVGISTFEVDNVGNVYVQRAITTYQKDSFGIADDAYLDLETMFNIQFMRYDFRSVFTRKYSRARLIDDGTIIRADLSSISPKVAKVEANTIFDQWQFDGRVENAEQFKRDLSVVRSGRDRLIMTIAPQLISHFRIGDCSMQFMFAKK